MHYCKLGTCWLIHEVFDVYQWSLYLNHDNCSPVEWSRLLVKFRTLPEGYTVLNIDRFVAGSGLPFKIVRAFPLWVSCRTELSCYVCCWAVFLNFRTKFNHGMFVLGVRSELFLFWLIAFGVNFGRCRDCMTSWGDPSSLCRVAKNLICQPPTKLYFLYSRWIYLVENVSS